ncbi:hypothetical protein EDD86DRAFT_273632 [Gorgonomyces haynaldii]|nr:hypothetical protein EDD86DRAFT_273632 [Gorgonomyces haynaldii]
MSTAPYLLGNFFENGVYILTGKEFVPSYIAFPMSWLGLGTNLLTLIALLRGSKKELGYSLVISISVSNLLVIMTGSTVPIVNVIKGYHAGGKPVCIMEYLIVIGACFVSILSLAALALLRYIRIVKETRPSFMMEMVVTAVVYIITFLIVFFPVYAGHEDDLIRLMASKLICSIRTTPEGNSYGVLMVTSTMCVLGCSLFTTCFCYAQIILKFINVKKGAQSVLEDRAHLDKSSGNLVSHKTTKAAPKEKVSEQEKALFRKTLSLTLNFVICWTPYLFLFLYELIVGKLVSLEYDAFCACMGLLSCINEPYITLMFNKNARQFVFGCFGIQVSDASESAQSKTTVVKSTHAGNPDQ